MVVQHHARSAVFVLLAFWVALLVVAASVRSAHATEPSIQDDHPRPGYTTHFDDFSGRQASDEISGVLGTWTQSGTGGGYATYIDTATDLLVYQAATSGTTAYSPRFVPTAEGPWDPCELGTETRGAFSLTVKLASAPTTDHQGNNILVGWSTATQGSTSPTVMFIIDWDGATWDILAQVSGSGTPGTGTVASNFATGSTVTLAVSGLDCLNASALFTATDGTTTGAASLDGAGALANELGSFGFHQCETASGCSTAKSGGVYHIDNIRIEAATQVPRASSSWCPDAGDPAFGFNYKEGVVFEQQNANAEDLSIGINDYYWFSARADNFDYLGKGLGNTGGTQDTFAHVAIEAATDNEDSIFRVFFSEVNPIPIYALNTATDQYEATAKGNGGKRGETATESFANGQQIRFEEVDGDWRISYETYIAGGIAQQGQAWKGGNPNDAMHFEINLKTDSGGYISVELQDGTPLLNRSVVSAAPIYQLWFVAESNDVLFESGTALNNNDSPFQSSCWFFRDIAPDDLDIIGNEGTAPFTPASQDPLTSPSGPLTFKQQSVRVVAWTLGGAVIAFFATGGRIGQDGYRASSHPVVVGGAGYSGMLFSVITVAPDLWVIPTLVALAIIGYLVWARKGG